MDPRWIEFGNCLPQPWDWKAWDYFFLAIVGTVSQIYTCKTMHVKIPFKISMSYVMLLY